MEPPTTSTSTAVTMTQLPEMYGHSRKVYALEYNSNGSLLASGSNDRTIRIWFVDSNQEPNELRGHTDSIHSIAWDPTNPWRLASTGADKTVRIWDVKTCKIAYSISLQSEALNIVYSYDGKYIAVSNLDCVMLIDTRKNRVAARVVNPYEACMHARLCAHLPLERLRGRVVVSPRAHSTVTTAVALDVQVNEVQFSKSGFLFVAAGHAAGYGTFEIMRIAPDKKGNPNLENVHKVIAHAGSCFCLDFHPSGRYVALGGVDSLVSIWDLEELYCVRTFVVTTSSIRTVRFNHDGRFLAIGMEDTSLVVVEAETGETAVFVALQNMLQYLCWHPSKNVLAYVGDKPGSEKNASREGVIKLLEIKDSAL